MRLRSLPPGVNATASQALSSIRSFAFLIIAARTLTVDDFGLVAVVSTATIAFNELLRAVASHPLALVYDDRPVGDDGPLARAVSLHVALAGVLGAVCVAMLLVVGLFGRSALVVGFSLYVAVGWLDALRTGSINRGRADRSVVIDAAWTALLVGLLPIALSASPTAVTAVAVWGLSAAATALGATLVMGLRLSWDSAKDYWQAAKGVARALAVQVGLESVPTRAAPLIIAAMVGVEAAGSIRGAEVLLGGAAMVYSGVGAASLRQARQETIAEPFPIVVRNVVRRFSLVLGAVGLNLAVVLLLPDRLGTAILGNSWAGASDFAPIQALVLSGLVALAVVSVIMRASLAMAPLVRIGMLGVLVTVVLVPSATALGGPKIGLAMIAVAALTMSALGARWILHSAMRSVRI